jgi:hypothetical protein
MGFSPLCLLYYLEGVGSRFDRNVFISAPDYGASYPSSAGNYTSLKLGALSCEHDNAFWSAIRGEECCLTSKCLCEYMTIFRKHRILKKKTKWQDVPSFWYVFRFSFLVPMLCWDSA